MTRPDHRVHALTLGLALLLAPAIAFAQYRLPLDAAACTGGRCYPTKYVEHGSGLDWSCGHLTYSGHQGTDLAIGGFNPDRSFRSVSVVAAAPGVVTHIVNDCFDRCTTGDCLCTSGGARSPLGNKVRVLGDDGRVHLYGHLRRGSVRVAPGQRVDCGTVLAEVGSSGWSTGPHLHFEVQSAGGAVIDPFHGPCNSGASLWIEQGSHGGLPRAECAARPACRSSGCPASSPAGETCIDPRTASTFLPRAFCSADTSPSEEFFCATVPTGATLPCRGSHHSIIPTCSLISSRYLSGSSCFGPGTTMRLRWEFILSTADLAMLLGENDATVEWQLTTFNNSASEGGGPSVVRRFERVSTNLPQTVRDSLCWESGPTITVRGADAIVTLCPRSLSAGTPYFIEWDVLLRDDYDPEGIDSAHSISPQVFASRYCNSTSLEVACFSFFDGDQPPRINAILGSTASWTCTESNAPGRVVQPDQTHSIARNTIGQLVLRSPLLVRGEGNTNGRYVDHYTGPLSLECGGAMRGCPAQQILCGDRCTNTDTDAMNCGVCGTACESGQCLDGACVPCGGLGELCCRRGPLFCRSDLRCDVDRCERVSECRSIDSACTGDSDCCVGLVCPAGRCVTPSACPPGRVPCGALCVNTTTDQTNCGACGRACTYANASGVCVNSRCILGACVAGFGDCDGSATNGCERDLRSDSANCGRCGNACTGGQRCASGACVTTCPTGQSPCGSSCIDTRADRANCGRCGNACPAPANATSACTAGVCGIACNVGFANCDGATANGCERDLNSDPANCGRCGNICGGATRCTGGTCASTCAVGQVPCGGRCVDTRTDPVNCGRCGGTCPPALNAAPVCAGSTCGLTCTAGFGNCDGASANGCEADLRSAAGNCGSCGNVCRAPTGGSVTCSGGVCRSTCPSGQFDCGGVCRSTGGACSAGRGACLRAGTLVCAGSNVVCSASPGTPAAFDVCDNGSDDNCDGSVDDAALCTRSCSAPTLSTSAGSPPDAAVTTIVDYANGDTICVPFTRSSCANRTHFMKIAPCSGPNCRDSAGAAVINEEVRGPTHDNPTILYDCRTVYIADGFVRGQTYRFVVEVRLPGVSTPIASGYRLFRVR